MSRLPVAWRAFRDLKWTIFWFGGGLALYGASMILLYPQFEDYLEEVAATYPQEILDFFGGADITSPSGFVTLEYQTFAVVILMVYAVVVATGQLAGEEGRGTLEALMAQPITRRRLIAEKALATLAGAVAICGAICVGWLVTVPFIDLNGDLGLLELFGATSGVLPIVALFGALGFLLGAVAPSRAAAAGILTALAVASYIAASLAQAIQPIAWMRHVSPYYYSDAHRWLTEGPVWWHQAGLAAAAVAVFALAMRAFEGREVAAGTWQLRAALAS
jgi:ABC-2 type transport system permease protein